MFSFLLSHLLDQTYFSQLKISFFFLFLSQHSFSNLDPLFPCFNHRFIGKYSWWCDLNPSI
jgi:hypothetical protein